MLISSQHLLVTPDYSAVFITAASLADTRLDPATGKNATSPLSSPSKSPQPRRRSSLSLADFKFRSGTRRKEKSPSPLMTENMQRRSSVEDDIKKHIAEVRAKKAQRTMV